MKPKSILTIALLVFVASSLIYMVVKEKRINTNDNSQAIISEADKHKNKLIVYYFHNDVRCPTCHKLENYAKEALNTYFKDKLESQHIIWEIVNVDKSENSHYIGDYKLVTKSIVLSKITNGKESEWKNLDQIWQKVQSKESYLQYIRDNIQESLQDLKL